MNANKKPQVAFILSFFVPGAGLVYLDKWSWGLLNFAVVNAMILLLVMLPLGSEVFEYFHYVLLMLAAASAGIAHAVATASPIAKAVPR